MDSQDLHPVAVITMGELIGNAMALDMPFNIQNLYGNWLMLAGQAMITFNAQQQFFENGPGNCYDRANRNIGNPQCQNSSAGQTVSRQEFVQLQQDMAALQQQIGDLTTIVQSWCNSESMQQFDQMYHLLKNCFISPTSSSDNQD